MWMSKIHCDLHLPLCYMKQCNSGAGMKYFKKKFLNPVLPHLPLKLNRVIFVVIFIVMRVPFSTHAHKKTPVTSTNQGYC